MGYEDIQRTRTSSTQQPAKLTSHTKPHSQVIPGLGIGHKLLSSRQQPITFALFQGSQGGLLLFLLTHPSLPSSPLPFFSLPLPSSSLPTYPPPLFPPTPLLHPPPFPPLPSLPPSLPFNSPITTSPLTGSSLSMILMVAATPAQIAALRLQER